MGMIRAEKLVFEYDKRDEEAPLHALREPEIRRDQVAQRHRPREGGQRRHGHHEQALCRNRHQLRGREGYVFNHQA